MAKVAAKESPKASDLSKENEKATAASAKAVAKTASAGLIFLVLAVDWFPAQHIIMLVLTWCCQCYHILAIGKGVPFQVRISMVVLRITPSQQSR